MRLTSGILKVIKMYNLTSDSQEYQDLHNDLQKWETEKATKDSTDFMGKLIYKANTSIWFRLAMPFIFFFAMSEIKKLMAPDDINEDEF